MAARPPRRPAAATHFPPKAACDVRGHATTQGRCLMLLYTPNGDEMDLPIGDEPHGGPGPDVAKVDQAAELFYRNGHARRGAYVIGGQVHYLSDRTWFMCVRDTSKPVPEWVLYAVVERPTGVPGQYRPVPISAVDFA